MGRKLIALQTIWFLSASFPTPNPPPPPLPALPRLALGPAGNQLNWLTLPWAGEKENKHKAPDLISISLVMISSFKLCSPSVVIVIFIFYSQPSFLLIITWITPKCKIPVSQVNFICCKCFKSVTKNRKEKDEEKHKTSSLETLSQNINLMFFIQRPNTRF